MKKFEVNLSCKIFKVFIYLIVKEKDEILSLELEEKTKKALGKSKFSTKVSFGEFKIFDSSNHEYKKDYFKLSIQKVIETFKDLSYSELTNFELFVEEVSDITKEKADELETVFTSFLKS